MPSLLCKWGIPCDEDREQIYLRKRVYKHRSLLVNAKALMLRGLVEKKKKRANLAMGNVRLFRYVGRS